MGLNDRDYMRRPDPGLPPRGSAGSGAPFQIGGGLLIGILLIFVALAAIIVQGFKKGDSREEDEMAYYDALYEGHFQPFDVNTASREELLLVPMMSEQIADGIIAKRPFKVTDELMDVRGIGEVNLEIFLMHLYGFDDLPEPRRPKAPGIPDA